MVLPAALLAAIEEYNTWIDAELKKIQEATKVEATLYHYTNVGGLRGIIQNECIWFTDFRHMNDPSEVIHGIDMARDVIRDVRTGADGRVDLFLQCLADMMTPANFSRALEYFIGSFSRASDDLGQWRAYADNGRGVAIGFAPHLFRVENTTNKKPDEAAFVSPVIYDVGQVCGRHGMAIEKAAEIFLNTANAHAHLLNGIAVGLPFMQEFARAVIASPLIWNCLTSKHPAYAHEEEVRLIILGMHDKLRPYIQTRIRGAEIVPYIPYKMAVGKEHSIGHILVGPAANPDAERTVKTMLESLGITHDIPISRSLIPYRVV
jgi:Protein of unknown function (DUF2971)